MNSIKEKIQKVRGSVSITKILALVRKSSKNGLYLNVFLIILELIAFFGSFYLLKMLIDVVASAQVGSEESRRQILLYITLAGVAGVAYYIIRSFSGYITETQSARVAEYVNAQIHKKAVGLNLSFYESPSYYDTLKRAMDSGGDRPALMVTSLIDILKNCASLIAIGSVLIVINWILLPLLALFILPTLLVRLHYSRKLNEWRIEQTSMERKSSYYSTLITTDSAAKEIRAYNLGDFLLNQFIKIRKKLMGERLSISFKRTRLEMLTTAISNIGVFVCIGFIALRTLSGETTAGDITLFLVAFPQSFSILQNIAGGISIVYQNSIYVNSVFELLEISTNQSRKLTKANVEQKISGEITFRNVSFTYPHSEQATLSDINLKIPSGKIIAIAGLNGAGKSTLIKLLCRLYEPTAGSITIGGLDINNYSQEDYQKMVAVVFQDFNKYAFTAADNIIFGDIHSPFSEERMKEAAKNSGASSFIARFPMQYDTVMGRLFEEGQEVSIGQWQKLALARCFYSDAGVLILDEATSAQDAASENDLFNTLRKKLGNKTAVIISHRHSSLKKADYIYFLANGTVAEEGTDEELCKKDGYYAKLFLNKKKEIA